MSTFNLIIITLGALYALGAIAYVLCRHFGDNDPAWQKSLNAGDEALRRAETTRSEWIKDRCARIVRGRGGEDD